jgi:hypothetical protein
MRVCVCACVRVLVWSIDACVRACVERVKKIVEWVTADCTFRLRRAFYLAVCEHAFKRHEHTIRRQRQPCRIYAEGTPGR